MKVMAKQQSIPEKILPRNLPNFTSRLYNTFVPMRSLPVLEALVVLGNLAWQILRVMSTMLHLQINVALQKEMQTIHALSIRKVQSQKEYENENTSI